MVDRNHRDDVCASLALYLAKAKGATDSATFASSINVSRAYVFKLLDGKRFPSPELLLVLRRNLGLDINAILDNVRD